MPAEGLCLRVTHTGLARTSLPLNDIEDGVGFDTGDGRVRRAGAAYVPESQSIDLVYTSDVAKSFESGTIRGYIDGGHLIAEFIIGTTLANVFPSILDEGVLLTTTPTSIDFVGAGVTATVVGDAVTVTIPGGAVTDHSALSNLPWNVAGHTGTVSTIAAFDGGGAATNLSTTVSGDVSGTFPGPLLVNDLTMTGEAQGDIIYFDGTNWVVLPAGTSGQLLQTNGAGSNPAWVNAPTSGTLDHAALTSNLAWLTSGHTGAAGSLAAFNGAGAAAVATGAANGDTLYFDGAVWTVLSPGTSGQFLQTQGAGSPPQWANPSGAVSTQLLWGANSIASSTTTRYLFPGFDNGLAQTSVIQIRAIRAGTLQKLRVRVRNPKGNGNNVVYTLRINGVASAVTVTMASTASDGSDLVNSAAVAAGDLIDIEVTKAASVGSAPIDVAATVEFV